MASGARTTTPARGRPRLIVNEPARFHAVSTLLAQEDAAAAPALARLLGDEESLRVRTRIAEGLSSRGWTVPEEDREAARKGLPPGYAIDASGRVTKPR